MTYLQHLLRVAVAFLLVVCGAAFAQAFDVATVGPAERSAETLRIDLAHIEADLQLPTISDAQLVRDRDTLETVRTQARDLVQSLDGPMAEMAQQIAKLGPAPAQGQKEADSIGTQRADLNATLQRIAAARKQLELIAVESEQLGARAAALQRDKFFGQIFQTGRSLAHPALWYDAAAGLLLFAQRITALLQNWWIEIAEAARPLVLLLIPLILATVYGGYRTFAGWLRRRFRLAASAHGDPSDLVRLWLVVRAAALTSAALAVLIFAGEIAIRAAGLETPRFELVFWAAARILFETVVVGVLIRRIVAPGDPVCRLVDVDEAAASRIVPLVTAMAFVAAAEQSLSELAANLYLPFDYTVAQSAVAIALLVVLSGLLLIVLRRQKGLDPKIAGQRMFFDWMVPLAPVAWLILAAAAVALLSGYLALGKFLARQLFETTIIVSCLYLLHRLADCAITASLNPQTRPGRLLRQATGLGERGIERLGTLFKMASDIALVVIGIPLLLVQLTLTWIDLRAFANTALLGFQIGDITITPSNFLLAIVIFAAGVALTRGVMRWLNGRVLKRTRLDKGVQDSIKTSATYVGYLAAAAVALSVAGLQFSNLAFIAGALGIGIGFGLQSIVNNFVSGLILLAERPIRVGDWVTLPNGEGLVRRINVRSTEIETFDHCTIIVPNSDLITKPVNNWTHQDTMGRFHVTVGVAYNSDVDVVRVLLLDLAKAHKKVLTYPEPQVLLTNFALNSITFELSGYVADVFNAASIASELRLEIAKAFRDKGVMMPVPQ